MRHFGQCWQIPKGDHPRLDFPLLTVLVPLLELLHFVEAVEVFRELLRVEREVGG